MVQLMMSEHMFQRQLAAALYENLVDPVYDLITASLSEGDEMTAGAVFVVEPYTDLLGEKVTELDKIVESSFKDLDVDRMMNLVRNSQNCLYSKREKFYAMGKKSKTQAIDEHYIMGRLGGTETFDVRTIGESESPEDYLLSALEKSKNKRPRGRGSRKTNGTSAQGDGDEEEEEKDKDENDEIKDELTKKIKVSEDGVEATQGTNSVRISTILIRLLDVARVLLFNLDWEIRHGASLIIRATARKASKFFYFTYNDSLEAVKSKNFTKGLKSQVALERESGIVDVLRDTVTRSLLILGLDRFSDFVGDKSNIIVRDIASQSVAEALGFLKSQEIATMMIKYFHELLARDIKQGWEPKQGVIYLATKLISKIPKLTRVFFKEFCDTIHEKIGENEEILEVSCTFFQQILANEGALFSTKALNVLGKSYLESAQKLDDVSYSVSPVCQLLGDFFKEAKERKITTGDGLGADKVKGVMIRFFFHHIPQVRGDLFYMLAHWLLLQGEKLGGDGFQQVSLLAKMYLVGLYAEEEPERRAEMTKHLKTCSTHLGDDANLCLLSLASELCKAGTVKQYLSFGEDSQVEELLGGSKSWSQTGDEPIKAAKLIMSISEIVWSVFSILSHPFKSKAIQLFNNGNTLQTLLYLSLILVWKNSEKKGSSSSKKVLEGSEMPDLVALLNFPNNSMEIPQVQLILEELLAALDTQVRDYLGTLEFPEIVTPMFKVLKMLELRRDKKWDDALTQIETFKNDMTELKKALYNLAMSNKVSYTVYKMQAEVMDSKVIGPAVDLIGILYDVNLRLKGLAATIKTERDLSAGKKPDNLNLIIKPLLALLKIDEMDSKWADVYSQGLFALCMVYKQESSNPNHKVIANLMKYLLEYEELKTARERESQASDPEYKPPKPSLNTLEIPALFYFEKIFSEFREECFEKYPNLKEVFESPKLMKLYFPLFSKYCIADVEDAVFTKLEEMAPSAPKSLEIARDFKPLLSMIFLDCNSKATVSAGHRDLLNKLLHYLHTELENGSALALDSLLTLLSDFDTEMLPYAKLYVREALKLLNTELPTEVKKYVYDLFTRILTLSYVADADKEPTMLDDSLSQRWKQGNEFLLEFRNNNLYEVDIPELDSVSLRSYQKEGISWLNFLFKYNLSGALCDDMGLGKTVQSLVSVLIYYKKNPGSKSLIICPNSLVKHWEMEANRHVASRGLKCHLIDKTFTGNWKQYKDVGVFIVGDTTVMRLFSYFEKEQFLVGVLDEAHLIKNEKSKLAKTVKLLNIKHKLALTGTPIQNNLLELWSIFDFLMPNYLGTRDEFKKSFARLFNLNLVSVDLSKMDLSDAQTKDLQILHQKVLPFILRRLKTQVLKDLPDKIIQDYYCEMTETQKKVYKVFEETDLAPLEGKLESLEKDKPAAQQSGKKKESSGGSGVPLLQSLIILRKICNHPVLIDKKYLKRLSHEEEKDLKSYDNSGKFRALRTLMEQLDFEPNEDNFTNPNKILVFSRFVDTLTLLENFMKHSFPTVKTLKIDGSLDSAARFTIVDRFFNEFDVKILFLTTKVGGLGLNLSCANIVVMFDHDFNPMNDLQAIDRAHRIGQKKVVNVYRFVTKDTLEERIMG